MRKRIFFICGSMNQTTQMHQISKHLSDYDQSFSPFYCDGFDEILRRLGLTEFTIAGNKMVERCRTYLQNHGLFIDYQGKKRPYDLVVTCTDVYLQKNIRDNRIVLVQEGIVDPESIMYNLVKRFRFLPRWMGGTATTGLRDAYLAFCVASEGDIAISSSEKVCKPSRCHHFVLRNDTHMADLRRVTSGPILGSICG